MESNGYRMQRDLRINIKAETTKAREKAPLMRLDGDLEDLVRRAYRAGKSDYLFSNKWERKCTPDKIRVYLKRKAIEYFGDGMGNKITPHYFRHRFFTECGKANLPIADVKAISGIKDLQVLLEFYSHSTTEGQDKVLGATRL